MSFVHLHVHTNFSFGDGACRIDELVAAAAEAGMAAAACTDHDGLYGAVRFYQACQKAGIKPIMGVELNVQSVLEADRQAQMGGAGRAPAAPLTVAEALRLAQHSWSRRAANEAAAAWQADEAERSGPPKTRAGTPFGGQANGKNTNKRSYTSRQAEEPVGYDGPLRGQTAAPGYHLVLLAKDYEGWSNLCRIISAAHLEHPGEPPWARWQTIVEHSGHLIALSACRRGELGQTVLAVLRGEKGARERARHIAARYAEIFAPDGAGGRGGGSPDAGARTQPGADERGARAGDHTGAGGSVDGRPSANARGRRSPAAANYFVELQHELLADSHDYIRELNLIAHELRLPTVATNNVHYVTQDQAPLHDVLAAEAANQPLPNPLGRQNAELYFKSAAQMRRLFFHIPEAFANSARIAARCTLDLGLGKLLFPAYPLPPAETAYSLLCKRCFQGAADRYRPVTPEVTARLEHELKVIQELGFSEYFLAVGDITAFARSRQIPYSGRGSAGNSIVSYVLRICDADPIEHDLLFERFLNPFRREMPDVDIDFCSARRDEVIEYIYERFGHDKVAMVATVNTMHAPSAVRLVARAFGFRPEEVNRISRKVPWGSAAKLSEMLAERPELHDHEFQGPHYNRLIHLAEKLADYPAHLGTHLGGFILARDDLTDRVPLQWAAKGVIVAQFDKDDVETLGLVKMDILGLRMHSAIAEAVRRAKERTGVEISPWELPRDDPKVYELIQKAQTLGMFQLESSGQRNLATRLREKTFEDVIAAISLFRPGPLQADMIAPFIRRRHGLEKPAVPHPAMIPALKGTYGVIIYQEQVIAVASAVAGFSLAEGDMLRRAMTHDRSLDEMDQIGRTFVERAVANGIPQATAEEIFRQLRGFAAYGFNKAHAACFAILCNASAWLKAHYPAEFYCGLLNNQPMGFYSPRVVLNDARRFGIAVLPVDVNRSEEGFCVEDDGRALRMALKYVKNMSTTAMHRIVAERGDVPRDILGRPVGRPILTGNVVAMGAAVDHAMTAGRAAGGDDAGRVVGAGDTAGGVGSTLVQESDTESSLVTRTDHFPEVTPIEAPRSSLPPRPYFSLADFVERTRTSVEITENLVRVGAFDTLGTRREELLAQLPILYAGISRRTSAGGASRPTAARDRPTRDAGREAEAESSVDEALRLVADELPSLSFLPSWSLEDHVRAELNVLGLNVSAHPLAFLRDQIRALRVTPCAQLPNVPHGRRVRLAGVLERAQMPWIRSGHRTLFLTLEDETELAQVVVFNDTYLKYGRILKDALYFYVEGVLQNDEEHGLAVVAQRIFDLLEVVKGGAGGRGAQSKDRRAAARSGGGTAAPSRGAGRADREGAPNAPPSYNATPPGSGAQNRYPFTGPAPEDTRAGSPPRRLDLPEIQPRTRPGRTG